jgi:tRNA1(Val) A37 N6-methylase TrmN6
LGAQGRPELEPSSDEDLCFLSGDWRVFQKRQGHRWSLDDLMTAAVAAPHATALKATRLLDLGCGLGSVLLLMAWKFPASRVTGIEAQADRAQLARRSIAYNGAGDRCEVITGDLRDATLPSPFEFITGTPPYFPRGTGVESAKTHATPCRFEVRGGVEDYLAAASRLLAPGGRAVFCSAALEQARVEAGAAAHGFQIIEHVEVVPRAGKAPLVMVDVFSRTAAPRVDRSLTVRGADHQWTGEFRRVRDDFGMPSAI